MAAALLLLTAAATDVGAAVLPLYELKLLFELEILVLSRVGVERALLGVLLYDELPVELPLKEFDLPALLPKLNEAVVTPLS